MTRIAILYGGKSGEHEVSLVSAGSILRHLDASCFEPLLIGIDKSGAWRLQSAETLAAARDGGRDAGREGSGALPLEPGRLVFVAPGGGRQKGLLVEGEKGLESLPCDAVFPVLHGSFGEDGTIQGLLETAGLPYVGAPVLGSALGMDKEKAKLLWLQAGLPVVPFLAIRREELDVPGFEEKIRRSVEARFGFPAFVKPASTGSSVGAAKVASPEALLPALRAALLWDEKALIEPFVEAREIECAVLGNVSPEAFAPGEVAPSHEFYDYEAKYLDPEGARLEIPAKIGPEQAEKVRRIAVAAYRALELAGMARVDFFIEKKTGAVLLNEVNTIPGFTSISMYPKMCEAGGLAYSALITRLLELALERHEARSRIRYSY